MKPLAPDTNLVAEGVQLQVLRKMGLAQRFAIASSLIDFAIGHAWEVLNRTRHDTTTTLQRFAADHYHTMLPPTATTPSPSPTESNQHPMQDRIISTLMPVAETLEYLAIPYVIGGSIASILHGMPRTTLDIDMVADYTAHHIEPLVTALQSTCYIDRDMIAQAIIYRSSFNLINYHTGMKVDLFLPKQRAFDDSMLQRALLTAIHPDYRPFPIITPEDSILTKLEWYRLGNAVSERQWYDIQGVLKLQANTLDMDYLHQWAATLHVTDLFLQALEDAGFS